MSHLIFSPRAAFDLDDIYDYIAQSNPASAARIIQRIEKACRNLSQFPALGAQRDDLRPGLRVFPSGNFIICYRIAGTAVEIVRVVHGARDLPSLFAAP
jgi:toxin ParE1/3/4